MMTPPPSNDRAWSPHEVRELAVLACCDPRTARRFLRGEEVASTCAARLRLALERLNDVGHGPDDAA